MLLMTSCSPQEEKMKTLSVPAKDVFVDEIMYYKKNNTIDTLLYFRYDLKTDSLIFKEHQQLNIGFDFKKEISFNNVSLNLAYYTAKEDGGEVKIYKDTLLPKTVWSTANREPVGASSEAGLALLKKGDTYFLGPELLCSAHRLRAIEQITQQQVKQIIRKNTTIYIQTTIADGQSAKTNEYQW